MNLLLRDGIINCLTREHILLSTKNNKTYFKKGCNLTNTNIDVKTSLPNVHYFYLFLIEFTYLAHLLI